MDLPLTGVRVVDAASYLAGPGAATVMGDFGADVIKVEPLAGDGYRALARGYRVDYNWHLTSRNKRSIALDLTREEGRDILHRLIEKADVLIVNFTPAQLERFDLEYSTVQRLNPRLIFAHMSGFGARGPDRNRRGFDSTAWWARSGMMDLVREPGQPPVMGAPGFGDHASAMSLYGAIMMALFMRERTGRGCEVHSSLLANGVWANGMQVKGALAGYDLAKRRQAKGWSNPFTSVYGTADGRYVLLGIVNVVKEWEPFCLALECPEWQRDPLFAEPSGLRRNRVELQERIRRRMAAMTLDELIERLDRHQVTYSVVARLADVITDPQIKANDILVPTAEDDEALRWTVSSPVWVTGIEKRDGGRAPGLGDHTVEILDELGVSGDTIRDLADRGIVGLGGGGSPSGQE